MVICLEPGADLHMSQLMPLPLTVSCFSKIQIGFAFWSRLTWVVLDKGPLNGCVCIIACLLLVVTIISLFLFFVCFVGVSVCAVLSVLCLK